MKIVIKDEIAQMLTQWDLWVDCEALLGFMRRHDYTAEEAQNLIDGWIIGACSLKFIRAGLTCPSSDNCEDTAQFRESH